MNTSSAVAKKPGRPRRSGTSASRLDQVTVHLSPELVQALDDEIGASGLKSRSELIREACRRYLEERQEQARSQSTTRRMRGLSVEERRVVMSQAADALADYYRADPEIAEWHALDGEKVYDVGD